MKKNWIFGIAGLAIGYLAAIVIGVPQLDDTLLGGDISKVSKYKNKTVDPAIKAIEEKLQNDSTYLEGTLACLIYIEQRMEEFSDIVELTQEATAQMRGTEATVSDLVQLKEVSDNAQDYCASAVDAVAKAIANEDADLEETMNRTTLAYMSVGRQISAAKRFVEQADELLADKSLPEQDKDNLAAVRDLWSNYCAIEAFLSGNETEVSYWANKDLAITNSLNRLPRFAEKTSEKFMNLVASQSVALQAYSNINGSVSKKAKSFALPAKEVTDMAAALAAQGKISNEALQNVNDMVSTQSIMMNSAKFTQSMNNAMQACESAAALANNGAPFRGGMLFNNGAAFRGGMLANVQAVNTAILGLNAQTTSQLNLMQTVSGDVLKATTTNTGTYKPTTIKSPIPRPIRK